MKYITRKHELQTTTIIQRTQYATDKITAKKVRQNEQVTNSSQNMKKIGREISILINATSISQKKNYPSRNKTEMNTKKNMSALTVCVVSL